MSLSPYAVAPEVVRSTRQLALAMRMKGIPLDALDGWLSAAEVKIAQEMYDAYLVDAYKIMEKGA